MSEAQQVFEAGRELAAEGPVGVAVEGGHPPGAVRGRTKELKRRT